MAAAQPYIPIQTTPIAWTDTGTTVNAATWNAWNYDTGTNEWNFGTSCSATTITWQCWCDEHGQVVRTTVHDAYSGGWVTWNDAVTSRQYQRVVNKNQRDRDARRLWWLSFASGWADLFSKVNAWWHGFAVAWHSIGKQAEKEAAKVRAKKLLVSHLNPEQRRSYADRGFFYVFKGERRYRIDQGTHGNIKLVDKENRILGSYCIQPSDVPDEDAMLAQKLHIEHNHEEFLRVANYRRAQA